MAKARLPRDLADLIGELGRVAPFSTHPSSRAFQAALVKLRGLQAILETIDDANPGVLHALESDAICDLLLEHEPIAEVTRLIERHCSRREPLP